MIQEQPGRGFQDAGKCFISKTLMIGWGLVVQKFLKLYIYILYTYSYYLSVENEIILIYLH